jgi:CubicO group peptidase (beta-lactamase class C family)
MFQDFVNKVNSNNWEVFGIEVFHDGTIVAKHDFVPDKRHPIYSATKTITATAVGIAVKEGKFTIEAPLFEYLSDALPSDLTSQQLKQVKRITIRQLMSMSVTGFPFRPEGDNWIEYSLRCPMAYLEPSVFTYSNIPAYLVGVAVENAVGEHLIEYLKPRLFDVLEIDTPVYQNCPSGHFYGATGMQLTVNELSRIGQLYMQNGVYNGVFVLPSEWVTDATSIRQMNKEGGYGYFIWKYKNGYRISGKWGQTCLVFPKQKLMVTYLSNMKSGSGAVISAIEEDILSKYGI